MVLFCFRKITLKVQLYSDFQPDFRKPGLKNHTKSTSAAVLFADFSIAPEGIAVNGRKLAFGTIDCEALSGADSVFKRSVPDLASLDAGIYKHRWYLQIARTYNL